MKRTKQDQGAAGQPAVILPSLMTEQDRAIVARRAAGETQRAIAASFGIPVSQVHRAEWRGRHDAEGRALLAECADSIEGLDKVGALSSPAAWVFRGHHYHYDSPELTRLSDAAALGRQYWVRTSGATAKRMAEIDHVLELFGIVWSPIDRTPKAKPQETTNTEPGWWDDIVRHVRDLERSAGTGALRDCPDRDSEQGIALRLAFLNGYMESKLRRERETIDVTPDQDDSRGDLETAGNLVCLPGVRLVDVLHDGGVS